MKISELYAQKIENTSKVIYKYDAWGGLDYHIFGYTILDSTEVFNIYKVEILPFSELAAIPTSEKIAGIKHDGSDYTKTIVEKTKPIEIKKEKIKGFEIETKIYQYKGYANRTVGLGTYEFSSVKETRDSLFFYNLDDNESTTHQHLDTLKFKKNVVIISQTNVKDIKRITIDDLQLSESAEIISDITYFLKPKNKMKSNVFSDFGIFKQVTIKK